MIFNWYGKIKDKFAELEDCLVIQEMYAEDLWALANRRTRNLATILSKIIGGLGFRVKELEKRADNTLKTFSHWSPKLQEMEDRVATLEKNVKSLVDLVLDTQKNGKNSGQDELHLDAGEHTYHCYRHDGKWEFGKFLKGTEVDFDRELGAWII